MLSKFSLWGLVFFFAQVSLAESPRLMVICKKDSETQTIEARVYEDHSELKLLVLVKRPTKEPYLISALVHQVASGHSAAFFSEDGNFWLQISRGEQGDEGSLRLKNFGEHSVSENELSCVSYPKDRVELR